MSREITDYLHFYMGCEAFDTINKTFTRVDGCVLMDGTLPVLRPLESMTEEEKREVNKTSTSILSTAVHSIMVPVWSGETFKYLLSKGFDIFNLHSDGLCFYRNDKGELY